MRTKKDNDRTITQDMIHSAPYVWVGSEPYDRSEIHEAADFPGRTPAYALQKHKEKELRKRRA